MPDDDRNSRAIATPCCPRCGYDQRGVVETWKEACPLEGVCSECGLAFAWPDLFRPERFAPQWCVEVTPRVIGLPWAAVRTAIRSCWPWHFWKRLRMSHPIRVMRILMYLLLLFSPFALLYVGAQGGAAVIVLNRQRATLAQQQQMLPGMIQQWQSSPATSFPGLFGRSDFWPQLPSVRLVEEAFFEPERQRMLVALTALLARPPRIEYGYWQAAFEAVATPMSDSSSGSIVYVDPYNVDEYGQPLVMSLPYDVPPSQLWANFSASNGGWGGRTGPIEDLSESAATAGIWCMLLLGPLPVSLVLLPVTRKRAKVRWAHIGRVFLYSLAIPIVLIELVIAGWLTHTFARPATPVDNELWTVFMAFAMPIATIAWWWAAIKHYLRMPHALAVSIIMSVLCVLMIGAIIFVIGETFFA